LLVATVASLTTLTHGYATLGVLLALGSTLALVRRRAAGG
jgi:hypothetical protein